jgi:hypothetical protein
MSALRTLTSLLLALCSAPANSPPADLRFEISLGADVKPAWTTGRMLVVLGKQGEREPRRSIGDTGMDSAPLLGCDVALLKQGTHVVLDGHSAIFPIANLAALPAGDYQVQALFRCNPDLRIPNAPGNLYSEPLKLHLDPSAGGSFKLELTKALPPEEMPADTADVKYLKLESKRLSTFWGRPMFLRVAVGLPRDFASDPQRRFPLLVRIGGYGQRFTSIGRRRGDARGAADVPSFVELQLDGAGPLGDPYQVDSDCHGPYGAALTEELIPFVEKQFRCIGEPRARFTTGGSTGGWVSCALQVLYPDFFNGCWSFFPDGVDFRCFQLVDIYSDANAYVNKYGFERASKRNIDGETEYTMRHECTMENVIGDGDSYVFSGQQWGAWNATYSPRGKDGKPVPLWDPKTGAMDKSVIEHWKKYDLRLVLESNWPTLAPKLAGKLHVYVGDADDYFLNNAVVRLQKFLESAKPEYGGTIQYGWRAGHGWSPLKDAEMLKQMAARVESTPAPPAK